MPNPRLLAVLIALAVTSASAVQRAPARQADAGIAADRLTRIDRMLQEHVDENRIAGAVALVLRDGKPIYERAFGWSDKEARPQMTDRHDLSHRVAVQGDHERRDPVADRGRHACR